MALRRHTHLATLLTAFCVSVVSFVGIVYAMSFTLSSSTAETEDTLSATTGDFDGDGDIDYIAFNSAFWGVSSMRLYRNNGTGTYTPDTSFAPENNGFVAAADVDGDGDLDLLGVETAGSHIYKYTNDGTGTFSTSTVSSSALGLSDLIFGDFNNDGSIDFVTTSTSAQTQALYTNDGTGTFTIRNSSLPSNAQHGVAADFDSDGVLDLALATSTATVRIMRNSGTGAFKQIASMTVGAGFSSYVLANDVDADGDIDIFSDVGTLGFTFSKNDGTGTSFGIASGPYGGPVNTKNFAMGDFDNDGDMDMELAGYDGVGASGANQLWINNGPGTSFSLHYTEAEVADKTFGIGVGDIDADGDLDYIAANSGEGGGQANRHYKSNEALSVANAAPTSAPSSLLATLTSSAHGSGTVVLTWGSGADAITPTRMLQYQVRMGTSPGANNIVTGKTSGPFWVNRIMPNGQSRRMVLNRLLCGQTYYWTVSAVDTGYMSTSATETSFTLDSSCTLTTGSSSSSSTAAGNWNFNIFRKTDSSGQSQKSKVSVSVFLDLDQDGKRSPSEDYVKGSILTIQGITSKGKLLHRAVEMTGDTAVFSVTPSDEHGYTFSIDASSDVLAGLRPTNPPSQTVVVRAGDGEKSIQFAVSPFVEKKTCLFVTPSQGKEVDGTASMTLLQRLQDTYSRPISARVDFSSRLVSRGDVARLLLRISCLDPSSDPVQLKKDLRSALDTQKIPGKSFDLRDLSLTKLSADASMFYTLMANGVHIGKQTQKGMIADPKSPMTQGEFVETVVTTLPSDVLKNSSIAPLSVSQYYDALLHLGLLPDSLKNSFDPRLGLTWSQASDVLARLAFKLGHIELRPDPSTQEVRPSFTSLLPKGFDPSMCTIHDPERATNVTFSDVAPGEKYFADLQALLPLGMKNADSKTLWTYTGNGLAEYGIEHGETRLNPNDGVTLASFLRTSLGYLCQPPSTRMAVITGRDKKIQGTADNLSPRDLLTGLPKDGTLYSRLSYAAQEKTLPFNLHMLSFDTEHVRAEPKNPMSVVSKSDAAGMLASMFLVKAVRQGVISTEKASQLAEPVRYAIQEDLVHRKADWRTDKGGDLAEPLTNGELVTLLASPIRALQSDSSDTLSLGLQWYKRISK